MICVYRAQGATDAYLIQHWLERNGVSAVVRGESLISLRGEIPVGEAWPSVWVLEEDGDRARRCIGEYNAPKLVHPAWRCPRCGEECPPVFGSCWNCGADAP